MKNTLSPKDIRVDVIYKQMGGFVPLNSSGVRVTHIPTRKVFESDTERSQHSNREKAFNALLEWFEAHEGDKKYVTGFVVGKFCPLHKGHEYLIKTALEQCEKVIVLSYTSESFEGCGAENRRKWLKHIECDQDRLSIHVIDDADVYLQDNASDEIHRQYCASFLLDSLETTVQAVFTSEPYGEGLAVHLTNYFSNAFPKQQIVVDHVMVDSTREKFSISGTQLRKALSSGDRSLVEKYMSPIVIASFVRKILFLGGESTGKSTLVAALFKHFNSAAAFEFGRTHYDNRNQKLMYEDMEYIAKTQLELEDSQVNRLSFDQYLFCDTSPLTTMFYSHELFDRVSISLLNMVWDSDYRYHKVYVCAPDFPMVQDGTRQDETFRQKGNEFYIDHLDNSGTDYVVLTGTFDERLAKVIGDLNYK